MALATALSCIPRLNALALTVVVAVTLMGPEYSVEFAAGSLPSSVKWISAPGVVVASQTEVEPKKVPPLGVIVGVATFGTGLTVKEAWAMPLGVIPPLRAIALSTVLRSSVI